MKNAIIYISTFVAGAAIGSFVTYRVLEKKYRENFEQEVADVREMYTAKLVDAYNTLDGDSPHEERTSKKEKKATYVKPEFHDYTKHAKEADPSVIAKKPELSSLVREMGEETPEPEHLYADDEIAADEAMIYILDEEVYTMNPDDFEKIELEYFIDDDALVDDKGDLIEREERERFIGDIDLLNFETYRNDEDSGSLFVANKNMRTYFEILLNPSSYRKEILGIDDEYDIDEDDRPRREAIRRPKKLGDE